MSIHESNSWEESKTIAKAVGIDKDKNSQSAVKWAIEKLRLNDNRIVLVHVKIQQGPDSHDVPKGGRDPTAAETQQLFLPYRGFCARKGIRVKEVVLQGQDVATTLCEYINMINIKTVVVGASSRGAIARAFKNADVPTSLAKLAPDFCKVYAVSKGKTVKLKSSKEPETPSTATSTASAKQSVSTPDSSAHARFRPQESWKSAASDLSYSDGGKNSTPYFNSRDSQQMNPTERPFGRMPSPDQHLVNSNEYLQRMSVGSTNSSYESMTLGGNYSSTNFSGTGNSEIGHMTPPTQAGNNASRMLQSMKDFNLHVRTKDILPSSISGSSDHSEIRSIPPYSISGSSNHSEIQSLSSDVSFEILDQMSRSSTSSQTADIEDELRRLKQEIKQISTLYNTASQENSLEEAKQSQEAAMAIVEREKMKCKAAMELAQKAQRIAELESEKRKRVEMKFKLESEERKKTIYASSHTEVQYRKYTVDEIQTATDYFSESEKIGEGGYGPVFKGTLDHTPVAIKVLRPDISQGEKQFQREVEVLSRMRHPHMVILLGACPEYGCLVYEHMDNGTLEDGLNCKNGRAPLSWQSRFRIAVEIATALNFLHRTRPEPLVHRDLKPANILLDRNNVSKVSDVGLSRLVPPSIADSITQCCMTAAAGTFCYIDPEYQQTGMLGTKSDIYSLGVVLLQIITARPAMGLTYHVENAIDNNQFADILDPRVKDWPLDGALAFAKLALSCCELRRRDRPDLDSVILPELIRIRELGSQMKAYRRF